MSVGHKHSFMASEIVERIWLPKICEEWDPDLRWRDLTQMEEGYGLLVTGGKVVRQGKQADKFVARI